MLVYRICRPMYAQDLSGAGAKMYGGRWNHEGFAMLYTATNSSLAMLEILVHADRNYLQNNFVLVCLSIPDKLTIKKVIPSKQLFDDKALFHSKETGTKWLQEHETPVLKVPSMVNSFEHNFLINPSHADSHRITIEDIHTFNFDHRLT